MSRIQYNTVINGQRHSIVGGWDQPLQCYHLTVLNEEQDDADEAEEVDWDLWDVVGMDVIDFDIARAAFEVAFPDVDCPERFWAECKKREGNVVKRITSLDERD